MLAATVITDGVLFLRLKVVEARLRNSDFMYRPDANSAGGSGVHEAGRRNRFAEKFEAIPPLDGFTAKDVKVSVGRDRQVGLAVRYASSECGFCRADKQWNRLAAELQRMRYQIIVVLPSAEDEYSDDAVTPRGTPQEAYVSIEWISRFFLTATPTVLIFRPDHRLIWSKEGMLGPTDPMSAVRAIEVASRDGE
jgi:hypothetical protein